MYIFHLKIVRIHDTIHFRLSFCISNILSFLFKEGHPTTTENVRTHTSIASE